MLCLHRYVCSSVTYVSKNRSCGLLSIAKRSTRWMSMIQVLHHITHKPWYPVELFCHCRVIPQLLSGQHHWAQITCIKVKPKLTENSYLSLNLSLNTVSANTTILVWGPGSLTSFIVISILSKMLESYNTTAVRPALFQSSRQSVQVLRMRTYATILPREHGFHDY